jgi:ABC-type spermidine/putrescine transport system permease subunit II
VGDAERTTLPIRIFARIRDALTPEVNVVGVLTIAVSFVAVAIVADTVSSWEKGQALWGIVLVSTPEGLTPT